MYIFFLLQKRHGSLPNNDIAIPAVKRMRLQTNLFSNLSEMEASDLALDYETALVSATQRDLKIPKISQSDHIILK